MINRYLLNRYLYFEMSMINLYFFFQAEDGIRDQPRSRGLGDVYKRQVLFSLIFFITSLGLNSILNFPFSSDIPPETKIESLVKILIDAKDNPSFESESSSLPLRDIVGI